MGSIVIGAVGVLGTAVAMAYLKKEPRHCWFLGLAGLFPAWLIAFLGLLQPVTQGAAADVPLPPRALFSSGAALLGIIITDYLLRRMQISGLALRAVIYWIIGLVALLPAWCIALLSF